jgi:sec-independent protein translocase protein TatB
MFDIGFWELCIIGVVLLLVLGPERMPEVARKAGYWVGRTRHTVNNLRAEMKRELDAMPTNEISQAAKLAKEGLSDIQAEMTELNKGLKEKVATVTDEIEGVANTRLDEPQDSGEGDMKPGEPGEANGTLDDNNGDDSATHPKATDSEKTS